jgi:hypothetical protein
MKNHASRTAAALQVVMLTVIAFTGPLLGENWPMFRGPDGRAAIAAQPVPTDWSSQQNLCWTYDLPGPGSSSPILWGDRVFATCYSGYGIDLENPGDPSTLKRHLLCLDRQTGKLIWQQTVASQVDEDPYEGFITDHGYASSTPVTDGSRIYAFFGKSGVHAFDMDGKKLWSASAGSESDPYHWGGGSSPVLAGDLVVVNAGNEGSAVIAFRQSDGSEAWRVNEPKCKNSWSTPVAFGANGTRHLVFSVPSKIFALDPATGKEIWYCESPISETVIPSVAIAGDCVVSMGSRAGNAIAIRAGGEGDVSESNVVWAEKLRAGISTPVVLGDQMYWASAGMMLCADVRSGKELTRQRLQGEPESKERGPMNRSGSAYASPIAVGSRIYLLTRTGVMHVFETEPSLSEIATNRVDDDQGPFDGTPAVGDGQIFFRSAKRLYCVQSR